MTIKRAVKLVPSPVIKRYSPQAWSLQMTIGLSDLASCLLELQMLIENLSNSLTIFGDSKGSRMVLQIDQKAEETVHSFENGYSQVKFCMRDVEFLSRFLLEYYRDGAASVEHVDIDMKHIGDMGSDATLLVMAENSVAPISGEKARSILLRRRNAD